MVRIRYIGDQLIARAFEDTFHREHWDERHGLQPAQVAILTTNPQVEFKGPAAVDNPSNGSADGGIAG